MATISKREIKQTTGQSGRDNFQTKRSHERHIQREMEKYAHQFNLTVDDVREKETLAQKRKRAFGK